MKSRRHVKILELIDKNDIETQEELSAFLEREGYQVTQATVSRDIRELKLTKVAMDNGRQKYAAMPEHKWICFHGYGSKYFSCKNRCRHGNGSCSRIRRDGLP